MNDTIRTSRLHVAPPWWRWRLRSWRRRRGDGKMVERRSSVRSASLSLLLTATTWLLRFSLRRLAERFQEDAHRIWVKKGRCHPPGNIGSRALKKISKEMNFWLLLISLRGLVMLRHSRPPHCAWTRPTCQACPNSAFLLASLPAPAFSAIFITVSNGSDHMNCCKMYFGSTAFSPSWLARLSVTHI